MKALSTFLQEVPDYRRAQGVRVSMPAMLSMIVLGFMSGHYSMQSLRRFVKNNEAFFVEQFNLQHGVPSYAQIRTILQSVDFDALNHAFYSWASQYVDDTNEDWFGLDGKGMKSTVTHGQSTHQSFLAMVSVFVRSKGIALAARVYANDKTSEIVTAQELIEQLESQGMVLTLDALHCQKKPRPLSWVEEMTM